MFDLGFPRDWSTLKKLLWLKVTQAAAAVLRTITGSTPLILTNAVQRAIHSLTQYGKCTQASTPTPDAPIDIVCNNGRVVVGNCISSIPDGQGTFITPSELTTNRIYKAFPTGLVVGRSYTVTVTGTNWLVLVQQKKPDGTGSSNVSGWVTTYELTPEDGYIYGVAMRRSQDTITPADFNGTLTLDTTDGKPWTAGTPEVLTVSADGAEMQTVTDLPMLLSMGDYKDEAEIIGGLLTHKVGVKVLDGTESWALSDSGSTHRFRGTKPSDCHTPASRAPSVCTHFKYVSTGSAVGGMFIGASQYWYFIPTDQTIDTVEEWTAWLAAQYAAGTPVIVVYPLAEETTEQTTPHALHTTEGDNVVSVVSNVDPVELECEYYATA